MSDPVHKLIDTVPTGFDVSAPLRERYEAVLFFDAMNCNPNGDPDAGNMPRVQPDTLRGLVTDVCLKRKIRNFFSIANPEYDAVYNNKVPELLAFFTKPSDVKSGYSVFVRENAVFQQTLEEQHLLRCGKAFAKLLDELRQKELITEDQAAESKATLACEKLPDTPEKWLALLNVRDDPKQWFDAAKVEAQKNSLLPDQVKGVLGTLDLSKDGDVEKSLLDGLKQSTPKGMSARVKERIKAAVEATNKGSKRKQIVETYFRTNTVESCLVKALCETFFDIRFFGGVTSTKGPLEGSFYGQIRGPVQFTFAQSRDKVLQLDFSITRCAKASLDEPSADEGSGNRTMGRKHDVDYAIYRCHIHVSPAFAQKTGFSYADLDNFLYALTRMFGDYSADVSANRNLSVKGLVVFKHQSALGNAPAHRLLEMVKVDGIKNGDGKFKSSGSEFPQGLHDYHGSAPGGVDRYEPVPGYETKGITARKLVWGIPQCRDEKCPVCVQDVKQA